MKEKLTVTGIGSDLQGVGRLSDGRAVFIPESIPGETIEAIITRDRGRFCEANLCSILEPSGDRQKPFCPHFGNCGGCQGQHIRYERTLVLKRQIVRDALSRIGNIPEPKVYPAIGCPDPLRTRNKAEYPFACQGNRIVIGTHAGNSAQVIPVADCMMQNEASVLALNVINNHLQHASWARHLKYLVTRVNRAGDLMIILCAHAPVHAELNALSPVLFRELPALRSLWMCQLSPRPSHALDGRCTKLSGWDTLPESLMGLNYTISPQSFFQVNTSQMETLYTEALNAAGLYTGVRQNVLDAYCGIGTISLSAARLGHRVTGVEIVAPAIENAKENARNNGLADSTRFLCDDAARAIPRLLSRGVSFDVAILDPPRKGADKALLSALAQACIPTIVYVSCNPATLARDVKTLSSNGYAYQYAQPVDMFPWTGHVETVVLMSRAKG